LDSNAESVGGNQPIRFSAGVTNVCVAEKQSEMKRGETIFDAFPDAKHGFEFVTENNPPKSLAIRLA
jgi:hypothetical protein